MNKTKTETKIKTMTAIARMAAVAGLAIAATAPVPSGARIVYDAGAAFNDAGHNTASFAQWSLLRASGEGLGNVKNFETYASSSGNFKGISGQSSGASPWIRVNTGATSTQSGEEVLPNELLVHPANPNGGKESYPSDVVRFTAPEDGWYSANIFAHDTNKESNNTSTTNSGVQVSIRAQGNLLVRQIVSLEDCATNTPTHRFDFQMPVRHLAAGDTIEVVIGNKYNASNAHSSDMTGLRFTVTKEDEGAFYDSGIAMTNNLATRYENPYGSIADGTWYYLVATTTGSTTPPGNVSFAATSRFSTNATRTKSSNQRGFANDAAGSAPYILVNESNKVYSSIAPCELHVHPSGTYTKWPVIRFRPPESGYYTASVVVRDTSQGEAQYNANGVNVYLYVADTLVTNAYVSLEEFASTAHLTFDSRLMAAGEPLDIVVSASGNNSSDATAISAIVRRENGDVYDANKSFYAYHAAGSSAHPFPDALGGGATWDLGAKTNAAVTTQFYSMASYGLLDGDTMGWWLHAPSAAFSSRPYLAMATNGIAGGDGYIGAANGLLAVGPQEFLANPNTPGYRSSSPTLRASVPSDGIYRARGSARDLNNATGNDGVRFGITAAGGFVPASAIVLRENGSSELWEGILDSDRLWLKAGEKIDFVIDPNQGNGGDLTGLSACYVREGDAPSSRVVNIDIGGAGSGRLSSFAGRGREGWSNWTAWNALRPGTASSASVDNCREADGDTPRNVSLSLTRSSGAAIAAASGSTRCALLDAGAASTGTGDAYAFAITDLTPNAAYTLYLYGTGDALFTVGSESKAPDGLWFRSDYEPCFARFEATADANGAIAGTFAASSENGAAFGGLTILGEFPDYNPEAFVITIR